MMHRLAVLCLFLASCATPVAPSGGPPDRTPPALAASNPAPGAVNVHTRRVRLTFSEHVDQSAFARAFSVTPPFDRPPTFAWKGRRVDITFPDSLRPNTTYILSLDNTLRDLHGVALKQPLTLAFSTGPEINRGRLAGQVVEARHGDGVAGVDVYAYPAAAPPDALPERPAYRTQTGDDGRFLFEYLSREPFFVIALRDRNRNRRPDPLEAFAVPPRPALRADTTAPETPPWVLTTRDTLPPELRRIQPLSRRRVALRFADPVRLARADTAGWVLTDSLTGRRVAVHGVYVAPGDARQVVLLTDPLAPVPHRLRPGAVTDSSGNAVPPGPYGFTPTAAPDTARLRFLGFGPGADGPATPLPPGTDPAVRFSEAVPAGRLTALVAVDDSSGTPPAVTFATDDGVTYRLRPVPRPTRPFRVTVDGRALGVDTLYARAFTPLPDDALGELSGHAVADDTTGVLRVELWLETGGEVVQTTRPDSTGYFRFGKLPHEARYRFRAFVDRNGNGRWDGGLIRPFTPAEPVVWRAELPAVRARWEQEVPDTLHVR